MTPAELDVFEVELAEKTLIIVFTNVSAADSSFLRCINVVDYNRFTFVMHEHES